LGATDEAEEGRWRWVSGEPFTYTNWATGQPDNVGRGEHYVVMGNSASIWTGKTFRRYGYRSSWNDQSAKGDLGGAPIVVPLCEWDSAAAIRRKPDLTFVNTFVQLGHALAKRGQFDKAITAFREALRLQPDDSRRMNDLAWHLATCPQIQLRDVAEATRLATKTVELSPKEGTVWNTLGVVHYRCNRWKEAVDALEKSIALFAGKNEAFNTFFLAMAHWQLGNKAEARLWFDKGVAWANMHEPKNDELRRFRTEAVELVRKESATKENEPESKNRKLFRTVIEL
jgi:tetratricopeptide (TPR) repeat protein